jgi:hypothetical protein
MRYAVLEVGVRRPNPECKGGGGFALQIPTFNAHIHKRADCLRDGLFHYTKMLSHTYRCARLFFMLYCFYLTLISQITRLEESGFEETVRLTRETL